MGDIRENNLAVLIPGPFLVNPLEGGVVAEGNKDTAGLIRGLYAGTWVKSGLVLYFQIGNTEFDNAGFLVVNGILKAARARKESDRCQTLGC